MVFRKNTKTKLRCFSAFFAVLSRLFFQAKLFLVVADWNYGAVVKEKE
jgi:hypothetical protein